MEDAGHTVTVIEADTNAFENLKRLKDKTDIVFNINPVLIDTYLMAE